MFDGLTNRLGEWVNLIQLATALAIPIFLVWYYWRFVVPLIRFATTYIGLTAVLVILYLMVYGLVGSDLGIPYLFWHDDFWARALSSTGATMLLAVVGVIAFFLDPYPWATGRKIAKFVRADELIKHRVASWYSQRPPMAVASDDDPRQTQMALRWWDYLTFGMNTLIDPTAITPVQLLLEPNQENSLMLQRFLRAARGPFLLLLVAPALLPAVFTEVPRAAPTGKLGLEWLLHVDGPPTYNVSRHLGGYLIGLAAWLLGIQAGVLIIKALIRLSSLLHGTPFPDKLGQLVVSGRDSLRRWWRWWQGRRRTGAPGALVRAGEACDARQPGDPESGYEPHKTCPHFAVNACPGSGCPRGRPAVGTSGPADCVAPVHRSVAALVFSLLFLVTYAVLGYVRHLRVTERVAGYPLLGMSPFDLPPAFAICVALAVLAMVYASVAYLPRSWQIPVALLIVAWIGYANNMPYKYQFENMSYGKADLVPLRDRVAELYDSPNLPKKASGPLVSDSAALEAWKTNSADGGPDLDGKGRPKLVLVAVSGGATRSAYWTAVVLDHLERTLGPEFGRRVRIVSGASGGMLGAACYVTYRRAVAEGKSAWRQGARVPGPGLEPASILPTWIRDALPMRSMDPLARGISLTEFQNCIWPWTATRDRGVILEQDWCVIRYPLVDLQGLEADGKVPSMIFSPMLVEDGRRLLISNLELSLGDDGWASSPIIEAACRQIHQDEFKDPVDQDGSVHRRLSLSSLEYFRVFREKCHRNLYLSTAVRMSASFPFVSPAVNLPTEPPRRVVDAGYYDNYGIQVATSWVRRNREWLAKNTSGVLLVQIRDSCSIRDRLGVDDSKPGILGLASRGFQFITSPVDAVTKARNSTASFRNDADVATLDSSAWDFGLDKPNKPNSFFTSVVFENSAEVSLDPGNFWDELTKLYLKRPVRRDFREVSMSWYLARAEMAATAAAIPGEPPVPRLNEPDWRIAERRRTMIHDLYYEVLASAPGADRAIRLKRLDQLYNYERLINIKTWWNRKTR
jgi:hypothetical protein